MLEIHRENHERSKRIFNNIARNSNYKPAADDALIDNLDFGRFDPRAKYKDNQTLPPPILIIPIAIAQFTNLVSLNFYNNAITCFPAELCCLPRLKILGLSCNNLKSLPHNVGSLAALEHLFLFNNQIEALPDSLFDLKHLEWLDLGYNKLACVPESIGRVKSLRRLSLTSNLLTSLPRSLAQLRDLEELSASCNRIAAFSFRAADFPNMTRCSRDGINIDFFSNSEQKF